MKNLVYVLVLVCFFIPLATYFINFNDGLSNLSSDWSNFGSYVGGVYGTLGFFAVAYSIYFNSRQNLKLEQDQVFYKSMELLTNRISNASMMVNDKPVQGASILKNIVIGIHDELDEQCILHARHLLCTIPEKISDIHYGKILNAYSGEFVIGGEKLEAIKSTLLDVSDYNTRWENIKYYIGSTNNETSEMIGALKALGHVWFYKISIEDRKQLYSHVISKLECDYGEFVNGYIKNLKFIAAFVNEALNKELYLKFTASQISKYEIIILFYYAMVSDDVDLVNVLLGLGLLDGIKEKECLYLMIDLPSVEEINIDLNSLKVS